MFDLGTNVNTDTSFQDANPPSNLISSSKELKTLGFLAERFVRPPVSIILRFKSPVFVSHISFCTTVKPHHRSSLFEVWAAPYSKDSLNPQFVRIGRANLIQQHRSNDQRAWKDEQKSKYPEICMLTNYAFPGNRVNQSGSAKPLASFKLSNVDDILKHVFILKIVILKTVNANSSIAISDLKVFGRISFSYKNCDIPKETVAELYKTWKNVENGSQTKANGANLPQLSFFESELQPSEGTSKFNSRNESKEVHDNISETNIVPKEFLDKLTLVLMDVPMVLPCGQVIDRINLDKYIENEAKYGRSPNDPFTGRAFTAASKPIFDGKLKSRIDEYVLSRNGLSIKDIREKRKLENKCSTNSIAKRSKKGNVSETNTLSNPTKSGLQYKTTDTTNIRYPEHSVSDLDEIFKKALNGKRPIIASNDKIIKSPNQKLQIVSTILTSESRRNKCIRCDRTNSLDTKNSLNKNGTDKIKTEVDNCYQIQSCGHILCRNCLKTLFDGEKGKKLPTLKECTSH